MQNCTANANLSRESLWHEYTKDNSYCQVFLLGDYHSTFSFLLSCHCCCLKSDKPNHIYIPNGLQAATKVRICFSIGNNNFTSTSIEPFHTAEEANIHSLQSDNFLQRKDQRGDNKALMQYILFLYL